MQIKDQAAFRTMSRRDIVLFSLLNEVHDNLELTWNYAWVRQPQLR